jgi:cytochrome c553
MTMLDSAQMAGADRQVARPRSRKYTLIRYGLAAVGCLTLGVALFGHERFRARETRQYSVATPALAIASDAATIARGEHLAKTVAGCAECHGADFGGKVMDSGAILQLTAPNLTRGRGSAVRELADRDWIRAIISGVGRDGRSLITMPSKELGGFSNADVAAIVAFFKTVPAVDQELPETQAKPLGRVVLGLANAPLFSAEKIDHVAPRAAAPMAAVTPEYGTYLSTACRGCHGSDLRGGIVVHPGAPPSADISSQTLAAWTYEEFQRALREGKGRDGRVLDPAMPWGATRGLTDEELRALWLGLRQTP